MTSVPKSRPTRRIISILAATFLCLFQRHSRCQIAMFLKVGDIAGESNDTIHKDSSIVAAWSWGMNTAIDPLTRTTTRATFQNLTITKPIDSATPKFMAACAQGKHYDRATLILRKTGSPSVEFYRIILENILISSVQNGGSAGGEPFENISLSYGRIGVEYFQITPAGATDRFAAAWDTINNAQGGVTFPPTNDSDGDLLPDDWETQYGLDPTKNDADLDKDGDGATNFEEYIAGTSPSDPDQVFRAKLDLGRAGATLTMATVPGKTYRVLTSQSSTGPFNLVETIQATADITTLATTFDFPAQYFKIEVLP